MLLTMLHPNWRSGAPNALLRINFIAPYRHQSVGLVERYHQTLINWIRKMRFINRGSWTDYIDQAVQVINESTHSVTQLSPLELWNGNQDKLRLAHQRMERERNYRNQKRKVHSEKFYPRQFVLVWNERPDLTPFQPKCYGPFILTWQISPSMWVATPKQKRRPGRLPILSFHVDQQRPWSID